MFLELLLGLIALFAIRVLVLPAPKPFLHVYRRPGRLYIVKVVIFYLLIKLRRLQSSRAKKNGKEANPTSAGYGAKSVDDVAQLEKVQQLSDDPKAVDAVYFQTANQQGYYLVAATARRPHRVVNGLLYLMVPGVGLLESPKLPDAMLYGEKDEFGAEGLKIEPIEPMRKWKITYIGEMKYADHPEKRVKVDIEAYWNSALQPFDFDTDMSAWTVARAMSKEPWSREYFQILKDAHQTHYEQMGRLEGRAIINGQEFPLQLDGMRDHSYAHKREWKFMHRYGFHTITLQDGTRINAGLVSQPVTCSRLELGYVYLPDGSLHPLDSIKLPLWELGEGGTPPTDYGFTFKAAGRIWEVQVRVIHSPVFYLGWEWESKVFERMSTFTVNGIPGWGIAEWQYRHSGGRPIEYAERDPAWTLGIAK